MRDLTVYPLSQKSDPDRCCTSATECTLDIFIYPLPHELWNTWLELLTSILHIIFNTAVFIIKLGCDAAVSFRLCLPDQMWCPAFQLSSPACPASLLQPWQKHAATAAVMPAGASQGRLACMCLPDLCHSCGCACSTSCLPLSNR